MATPGLVDPNFDRTVVLVLEHGDEGALGVVLNRSGPLSVSETFHDWARITSRPPSVFIGGPVAAETVITLAHATDPDAPPEEWVPVFGGVGVLNVGSSPDGVALLIDGMRVFAGYAGWAPGQLEGEIEAGGWFVVDAQPDDVFTADPELLWAAVMRRQPGRLSLFAACPPDPSTN